VVGGEQSRREVAACLTGRQLGAWPPRGYPAILEEKRRIAEMPLKVSVTEPLSSFPRVRGGMGQLHVAVVWARHDPTAKGCADSRG
jgi:hypothetical protein